MDADDVTPVKVARAPETPSRREMCLCGWKTPRNVQVSGMTATTAPSITFNCPECGLVLQMSRLEGQAGR